MDLNPYEPPQTVSDAPPLSRARRREMARIRLRLVVVVILIGCYGWIEAGPEILAWRGFEQLAGWAPLWFFFTTIAITIAGALALAFPNPFTLTLFAFAVVPHVAVGLGFFPK